MPTFAHMSSQIYTNSPEILLWKTVVNDDEKAFETLFGLFYPALFVYAKKYVEEKSIREDLVQDVFTTLWENRKKLIITTSVRNYLVVSVRNNCLQYLRKKGLTQQYEEAISKQELSSETEGNEIYLYTELIEMLEKALKDLPDTYRLVFEMNRLEGHTYEEIAAELNISVRSAKRYNQKVIEHLKKELKDYYPLLILIYPFLPN